MKLCKLVETTTLTAASTSIVFVLRFVTVATTKLQISGKKNMIPMVVFILFGISMNLVRAENQYRQPHQQQQRYQNNNNHNNNNRQQQRLQPNVSDANDDSYYYECVLTKIITKRIKLKNKITRAKKNHKLKKQIEKILSKSLTVFC